MTSKYKYLLAVVLTLGLVSTAMAAGSSSSSKRPSAQPPSTYQKGVSAVKARDFTRALGLLERVVRNNPQNADAWNYIGFSHRNLKQFDQALAAYKKALAIDPEHRGANEYMGELYLKMGDVANAQQRLKKLDSACSFGCKEFDDLKRAIKTYQAAQK